MNILNHKIKKIYQGPWEASEAVDMPGVAGPTWYYANLFLQVDNGLILCVSVGEELNIVDVLPKSATPIEDKELKSIVGKRSIVGVYRSDVDLIAYVLLDDGSHIDYSYQPGGSNWCLDKFEEWSEDDIGEDDPTETYTSLVDGATLTWMQLVRWHNK